MSRFLDKLSPVLSFERYERLTRSVWVAHIREQQGRYDNAYRLRQDLFKGVVTAFVNAFIPSKEHLNPQFRAAVNA